MPVRKLAFFVPLVGLLILWLCIWCLSVEFLQLLVGKIELGSFNAATTKAEEFSAAVPLCGHVREAQYNDVSIIKEVLERSGNVITNVVREEQALENYTIFIANPVAYKLVERLNIMSVRGDFRAHGSQNAVLFSLQSPTNNLLVMSHDGALVLEDFSVRRPGGTVQHRVTLPSNSPFDDGNSHALSLTVNVITGEVTLVMDGVDLSRPDLKLMLPLPLNGFNSFEIGGSSILPEKTNVTQGYTGCLDNVMLNTVFVNLRKATTKGTLKESDIQDTCPRCLVERACMNRGKCIFGDEDKFTCDCLATGYEGDFCEKLIEVPTTKPVVITKDSGGSGGSRGGGTAPWIIILIIILLILLALLLLLAIYAYLRYARRHTGMFPVKERLSYSSEGNEEIV